MQPRIVRAGDVSPLAVLGVDHSVLIGAADTGGAAALIEVALPAGAGIPRHVHTREDEIFRVLEGEVEFELGPQRVLAPAGTTLFGPRNVPHSYRAAHDRPARFLVGVTPAGIERMFVELSNLPPGPPDMERVARIVAGYGISFA